VIDFKKISPYWYHRIELPDGSVTPGWAPANRESYRIPLDLAGKRVLDIGAWDGYWTFEALRRGASEVIAIDDFSDQVGFLQGTGWKPWATFDACKKALGYTDKQCRRADMSVYNLNTEIMGTFDVVFCFGVLYHCRHPLLALDKISEVCTSELYVESAILDDFSPYQGGLHNGYSGMVMEFYPENAYGNNPTNWWVPTLECMAHMIRASGFNEVSMWKFAETPNGLPQCRGHVKGVK